MLMKTTKQSYYLAPEIEVSLVAVEQGIAITGGGGLGGNDGNVENPDEGWEL